MHFILGRPCSQLALREYRMMYKPIVSLQAENETRFCHLSEMPAQVFARLTLTCGLFDDLDGTAYTVLAADFLA